MSKETRKSVAKLAGRFLAWGLESTQGTGLIGAMYWTRMDAAEDQVARHHDYRVVRIAVRVVRPASAKRKRGKA